ncbi:MAG: 6,7-dimethyl-8-ribityllumazine synthase [Rickettsiales bacterium]|nr:6,7-dimethyl-8-ribityllumazine synthase [Rickettsiales bacterium]|tara:strand:+ start:535 stop:978 length:444 start_codon:yes stop_codon:yes gene_type:complete
MNVERKKNILVVNSNYYPQISQNLLEDTRETILKNDMIYEEENVTGVFEIPAIITFSKHQFDGYIALGCVIRGETSHYDYVCNESARALMNFSLEGLAIGYGILTVENIEQAQKRSTTNENNFGKGKVAALACINQIKLKIKYTNAS